MDCTDISTLCPKISGPPASNMTNSVCSSWISTNYRTLHYLNITYGHTHYDVHTLLCSINVMSLCVFEFFEFHSEKSVPQISGRQLASVSLRCIGWWIGSCWAWWASPGLTPPAWPWHTTIPLAIYTLCSEKNTHSRFLLWLCEKCLDLHKIFRECLLGNKYFENRKVRYPLLTVTSCWCHIFMFVKLCVLPPV